ncbi:MAG: MFS transporter [Saprospiraceae bacterium]|nr:MFS transporter [Saprospiraceae bacterium]
MSQQITLQAWWHFFRSFWSNPQARAVGLAFSLCSWSFGSWVVHIPHVKAALQLDDAQLGWALFGLPAGQLFINPISGRLAGHFGPSRICIVAAASTALLLVLPVMAPSMALLVGGLVLFGASLALLGMAMNACVPEVEIESGHSIMAICHGLWSLGGMLSSGLASALLGAGWLPRQHILLASSVMLLVLLAIAPTLRRIPKPEHPDSAHHGMARPTKNLVLLVLIGFFALLSEGLAFDWSGVFLRDFRGAGPAAAALGFTAFTMTMTIGRFAGDLLIARHGERRLLVICGLVAAAGLSMAIFIPTLWGGWLGFCVMGLGCSLAAPMLFSMSMRLPNVTPAAGLATFVTFSFLAFLAGPPLIGLIANVVSLPVAMMGVAGLLLLGVVLARQI